MADYTTNSKHLPSGWEVPLPKEISTGVAPFSLQPLPQRPGPSPTYTDLVQQLAQRRQLSGLTFAGSNRSTFLAGPSGPMGGGRSTLLGG